MSGRRGAQRALRGCGVAVAVSLVVQLLGVPPAAPAAAAPTAERLTAQADRSVPGHDRRTGPVPPPRTMPPAPSGPAPAWPGPAAVVVDTAASADTAPPRAGGLPVRVTTVPAAAQPVAPGHADASRSGPRSGAGEGPAPRRVKVETLSRDSARAAGVNGLLLEVSRADGASRPGRVRLSVDYSGLRTAYGADWASRLRLVREPDGAALPTENDPVAGVASAEVDLAGGTAVTTLALNADPSGPAGDYAATSLQPSSTWAAGGSTGAFTWSYPMRVPPSLGGPVPEVALSYSSAAVDGRMAASNNQPSWVGEGFDYSPGFIERRYVPCKDDTGGASDPKDGDLCWVTDNATLSFGTHSGELLRGGDGRWHLRDDDGTRIERRTGAVDPDSDADNDGEYWVVTTSDGKQYWFGRNKIPGASSSAQTDATWTVPVYGNHSGEPCNTASGKHCYQAWRWNLDYVVDPSGNTMSFWYGREKNSYLRAETSLTSYTRGGYLKRIDYGTRADTAYTTAPMRVVFGTGDRCLTGCGTHDGTHWPDTPWDLACTDSSCAVAGPSFWTTKRLTSVTTYAGSDDVESWSFTQTFPNPGDGTRAGLWLSRISHRGLSGATTTVPDVVLTGVQLPNRVDSTDRLPAMNWWRLANVRTESGGSIDVSYDTGSSQTCVRGTRMPSAPQSNTLRCYPVRWQPDWAASKITDYFHTYLVSDVTETDLALPSDGRSPRTPTHYDYLGDPAWHYTDDDGLIQDDAKTWSVWRGYGRVRVTRGDPGEQTRTETVYFRGMDGDRLPSGTRSVSLPAAGGAPAQADADAFAGMAREEITYDGPGGGEVSATVNEAWQSAPTATRTISGSTVHARHTGVAAVHSRTTLDGGRAPRRTTVRTTFDGYGMPVSQDDSGDEAVTGDERCARTTYGRNTASGMTSYVSREASYAVGCAAVTAGGLTGDDVIADVRTSYDQQGWGASPTRGLASRVEELATWPSGYLTTSRASHDANGRVVASWDVRGNRTTTAYTPAGGGPVTATTTTNHLGWTTTTALAPAWGLPTRTVDPNGRTTSLSYDGLGRLTGVWLPGRDRAAGEAANTSYRYLLRTDGPSVVTTTALNASGGYTTSHTLYDAQLRARQTQAPAAGSAGGRIITDTVYDSVGREVKADGAYVADGTPSTDLFLPLPDAEIPTQTRTSYDGAGRTIASAFVVNGAQKWRTTTRYGGDHTDVTPPAGGTATSTVVDARGQTVQLRQYHAATPTGDGDVTRYGYDRKGRLTTITDAAGNTWTYRYDLRGRQIGADDPDKGSTSTTYNDAGDVLTTTDSRGVTLAYGYDSLGRRTELHEGSIGGTLRASWAYDTAGSTGDVKGRLVSSTRMVGTAAYVDRILEFDDGYRPTARRITVPASEGALAGSYTYAYSYAADGSPVATRLPAIGDLPTETLSTGYDTLGLPDTLRTSFSATGADTFYVDGTSYTRYGELGTIGRRYDGGTWFDSKWEYEQGTRRLVRQLSTRETSPSLVSDRHYGYDPAGNVTGISDVPSSGATDNQCFRYDYLRRLTEAWTPADGDCAADRSVAALGGPAPYWQSFSYDTVGNRLTSVDRTPTQTSVSTYTYPAAKGAQPHTLRGVTTTGTGAGSTSYTYDVAGNTTTRPEQTLSWDVEGHLDGVAEAGGDTSYVYDADGNRLIRRDPAGRTLYLPGGQELRAASGGATTGTRYYAHAGQTIGMRTGSGVTWLAADHHGTALASVGAATQAVAVRRQKPFGEPRGAATSWPGDKGFVGGTVDDTGLTHLGAREYDPTVGRFLSVDPILDDSQPQQLQGYAYGNNGPATFSDPAGTCWVELCGRPADRIPGAGGSGTRSGGSRDDCTGSCSIYRDYYTEKVKNKGLVIDSTRVSKYRHGTELVVYPDGIASINGFLLPAGFTDFDQLAGAVDDALWRLKKMHIVSPHPLINTVDTLVFLCLNGGIACDATTTKELLAAQRVAEKIFGPYEKDFLPPHKENWWDRHGPATMGLTNLGGVTACFFVPGWGCLIIGAGLVAGNALDMHYRQTRDHEWSRAEKACFAGSLIVGAVGARFIPTPISRVPWGDTPVSSYLAAGIMNVTAAGTTSTVQEWNPRTCFG